jgi:Zn-dependent protease
MASESTKSVSTTTPSPDRLWAEQLAMGLSLLIVVLIFMALFHPTQLSAGADVLGPNDIAAYGWISAFGVISQVVIHELGTILVAWRLKLPIRLRFFGLGANATATLEDLPRNVWTDAVVGLAGPLTGMTVSLILAGIYDLTNDPLYLGMACVGYFYNLITLVPILDLEGGWIASAIAPQGWLVLIIACFVELSQQFNLVLLCVFCFALPRFVLLIRARAPRTDLGCTSRQRLIVNVLFILMIIGMAWFGSTTFQELPRLVRESMGD